VSKFTSPAEAHRIMADALQGFIEAAVETALAKAIAMNGAAILGRRLMSCKEAGEYLNISAREILNMIARRQLPGVSHGRRRMVDIRDLDEWIERNKK